MKMSVLVRVMAIFVIAGAAQVVWANGQSEGAQSSQPVTLSVSASQGWIDQADKDIGDKFTTATDIKLDWQILPANQYITVLHTKLNAGEESDIYLDQVSPVTLKQEIDPAKNAIDLSSQSWVSRVDPNWKKAISVDGKVYALPIWNSGTHFVYTYSKAIFDKLQLPVPRTYDQFKSDAAAIKAAGIVPVYESVADGWHHQLPLFEIGAQYEKLVPGIIDKWNTNQVKFADVPQFVNAIKEIQEFAKAGYYGPNYLSNSGSDSYKAMADGSVAMVLGGMGYAEDLINRFPDAGPVDKWGIFVEPWLNSQYWDESVGGALRFGYSQSPHKAEILKYFDFAASDENLNYWLDHNTTHPLSVPFSGVKPRVDAIEQKALDTWPDHGVVLQHQVKYIDPQWMQVGQDLEAMFVGSMAPEQVAQNIDKRRAEQAKLQKDPNWQ